MPDMSMDTDREPISGDGSGMAISNRFTDLVVTVLFWGILLSFCLYVFVTMLLGAGTSLVDTYWDGGNYSPVLADYNNAYYKNQELQDVIKRYDYSLFNKTGDPDILVGKNNYLFEVVRQDNGYNYLKDFLGENTFDAEGLGTIYNLLRLRQKAYANQGVEYIVAVIPSAQTVYPENMPGVIAKGQGTTRLEQLSLFMRMQNEITFIDLTSALMAAKFEGQLYNNTENTLNSRGEYFVYQALYQVLPESVKAGTSMIPFEDVTFYTHLTDGKEISRRAGLSGVVKNRTVSLSSSMEFNYQAQELYPGIEITSANHVGGGATAGQTVLLEFSGEWDKIALMPYFSGTFDDVIYKSNHLFSILAVEAAHPAVVIQLVNEDLLTSLTNSNTALTYSAGLSGEEDPFMTMAPIVTHSLFLDENTVCLTGQVEEGAALSVYGDENYRVVGSQNGQFIVTANLPPEGELVLRLQASVAEKRRSEIVKITLDRGEETPTAVCTTLVGADSRLFRTQYEVPVLPDTGTASVMENELRLYRSRVEEAYPDKQVEFINVVIPGALSVYADEAPESLAGAISASGTYRARMTEMYESCGYTVLDLTDSLVENKSLGKLYELTEDRLTDIGAYVGYRTLITYIGKTWPAVRPDALSQYLRMTQLIPGGSLATGLGFAPGEISETIPRLLQNPALIRYDRMDAGSGDTSFATFVSNSELPVAIVLYNGEGGDMLDSMAQHFRMMIVLPEGETEISDQMLTLFRPDYIIRISSEKTPGLYDWETDKEDADAVPSV